MKRTSVCNRTVTLAVMAALLNPVWGAPAAAKEPETQKTANSARSPHGMVAADHPEASRAGARVLEEGGNAVDAAVTSLLVLGVVNPFASGLGGGGFCVVRTADGDVDVLDFRETAPAKAHRDMYVVDGTVDRKAMRRGGLAVGVPGEAMGLATLHEKYGKAKWRRVVEPARKAATKGFTVGELLPKRLEGVADELAKGHPELADEFRKDGRWVRAGERMKRPELGKLLATLQKEGAKAFYEGEVAEQIAATVQKAGGVMTAEDLAGYEVKWREPVRGTYRGHEIVSMPPPSSGGTTLVTALNILERYDLKTLGQSIESTHRITEAMKHAFADRARWLGDADFVEVPVERLTSKEYASSRKIRPDGVLELEEYGTHAPAPDDSGTTHVSVIDREGGMAACTSTVNTSFGSLVFVDELGLVLNNEMADFSGQPGVPNVFGLVGTGQNAVAPKKRPLSSMSPTLVLRDGKPLLVVGASGGPTIITGTLLAIIRTIDWGLEPEQAVGLPRIHHQWVPNKLFAEAPDPQRDAVLTRRGHVVEPWDAYNSVQLVLRKEDGTLVGVSDWRKIGHPAGAKK